MDAAISRFWDLPLCECNVIDAREMKKGWKLMKWYQHWNRNRSTGGDAANW